MQVRAATAAAIKSQVDLVTVISNEKFVHQSVNRSERELKDEKVKGREAGEQRQGIPDWDQGT